VKKLIIGAAVAFLAILLIAGAFGFRTDCLRAQNGIIAQYDQNRNNYDNMWKKFREAAQVKDEYVDDLKKVWDSTMSGRYGAEGSKAVFQFITEHNPNVDSGLYARLTSIVEAGRNSFEADQKQLIDKKNALQNILSTTGALLYNRFFGFPTIDMSKYDIVTSERTEEAFAHKKSDEIDIFGKGKK
jgi:hypothetical protein